MSLRTLVPITILAVAVCLPNALARTFVVVSAIVLPDKRSRAKRAMEVLKIISPPDEGTPDDN